MSFIEVTVSGLRSLISRMRTFLSSLKNSYKMMPVKEVLEIQHFKPRPPVLIIDESSINSAEDAGPVCGCDEKYDFVKRYKPFIIGGVNPYNRRKIPDTNSLNTCWKRLKIGEHDLIFDRPIAMYPSEIPHNFSPPEELSEKDLFLRQPTYTEAYLKQKLKKCSREHSEVCKCPDKKNLGADILEKTSSEI